MQKRFEHICKIFKVLNLKQKKLLLKNIVLSVLGVGWEALGIGMLIPIVSVMTKPTLNGLDPRLDQVLELLGSPTQSELLLYSVAFFVVVYLLKVIFLAYAGWSQFKFTFGLQADLSEKLFKTYLNQPYKFHLKRNSANLAHNISTEVSIFVNNAVVPLMLIVAEGLVFLSLGILLLIIEPLGALVVGLALGGAGLVFGHFTRRWLNEWSCSRHTHESQRSMHLMQGLTGIKEVILSNKTDVFLQRYSQHNNISAVIGYQRSTLQLLPRLWLELLTSFGVASLIFVMKFQGTSPVEMVPVLAVFAAVAFRLIPSANRLMSSLQSLRFGWTCIGRIEHEMNIPLINRPVSSKSLKLEREISVVGLDFSYSDGEDTRKVLKNINLSIKRGECVGFVGKSGSGKSTLADILLGLHRPDSGDVLVDGVSIFENLTSWQSQIGYVPQSIYLTDESILKNIAFGMADEEIDHAAINEALKAAQLLDFVASLPEGVNTEVGERGVRLSGGQRQRIGIARALYHQPKVLVLDEATSALDMATEEDFMEAIWALAKEKTVLIVAHRLTTLKRCDRIYSFLDGQIVQQETQRDSSLIQQNQ
jgi:ABC-type multidrug transport system fused ATPase/permease subunit